MIAEGKASAPITDDTGSRPVLAVGEHELVSDVFVRAARTGGCANLFVLFDDNDVIGTQIVGPSGSIVNDEAELIEDPIHRDIEIGMLIRAAETAEGGLRVRVNLPHQQGEVRGAQVLQHA